MSTVVGGRVGVDDSPTVDEQALFHEIEPLRTKATPPWIARTVGLVAAMSLAWFLTTTTLMALDRTRQTMPAPPVVAQVASEPAWELRNRGIGHPWFEPRP